MADPEVSARLVESIGAAADLRHPNLSAIYDWGVDTWNERRVLFVVVEVLRGGSLREILDRGRLLTPSQTLAAGLDACRGLDALHRHGVVHGDIRPASLVFGEDGRVRVVDVGVSSVLSALMWADPSSLPVDRARYASPEQVRGEALDARTDVYSLCLSLIEAATGQVPFVGDSTVATLANRLDRLMPVSADLGPLASVLERGGRPIAADRFNAAELGRALMQAAENLPRPTPMPLLVGSLFTDGLAPVDTEVKVLDAPAIETVTQVPDVSAAGVAVPSVEADIEAQVSEMPAVGPSADMSATGIGDVDVDVDRAPPVDRAESPWSAPRPPGVPTESPEPSAADSGPPAEPRPAPATRRRRLGRRGLLAVVGVIAVAAAVVAVWSISRPPSHTIPSLAGLDQGEALNAISGFEWKVEVVREASETVAAGEIVRTSPGEGASLAEGKPLQLFVSAGPAPRTLPEVAGLAIDAASTQLQGMGLLIRIGDQPYDENVPAGTVISWSTPAQPGLVAGDDVVVGTQVVVVVSKGPAPRSVATVTGLGLTEATAALTGQQLVVAQLPDEFSDTILAGQVVRQEPVAGSEVPRGSTVLVVLSKGQDLVAVPDLGPLDAAGVQAALTAAGLRVGAVTGDTTRPLSGASIAGGAALVAGQLVKRDSAIDLTYPAPPPAEPVVAP